MTTFKEAQNQAKQIKNAKRGGYTPTIAKDVNKHKVEKVKRLVQDLEKESAENMDLWHDGADAYHQGYADALKHVQGKLSEIL